MRPAALYTDPPATPFVCINCKAHAQIRRWFVDIGTDAEWEGVIYICDSCMADIVRVTPDFLSVEAHREIIAEYQARMEEFAALKAKFEILNGAWELLSGDNLQAFADNVEKVIQFGQQLELSRTIPSTIGDMPTTIGYGSKSESDNRTSDEPESTTDTIIVFS
jgi:hypothetical protein